MVCRYRLPRAHPRPEETRLRLDREIREKLTREIGSRIATVADSDSDVLVIRRLSIRMTMRPGPVRGAQVADLCARGLAQGVSRILAGEGDSQMVSRYASWAEYLAAFLTDLARGTAGGMWQYGSFSSLISLPFASAVRDAFAARPAEGVRTLVALERSNRADELIALLTASEAWAVFDALEPAGTSVPPPIASITTGLRSQGARRAGSSGALAIAVTAKVAAALGPEAISRRTLDAIRLLARAETIRRSQGGGVRGTTDASLSASPQRGAAWRELQVAEPSLTAALAKPAVETTLAPPVGGGDRITANGGIFLLLPGLAELDLQSLFVSAGCRRERAEAIAAIGRALILVKCQPPEARAAAWLDPALWLAADIGDAPARARLRQLGRVTVSIAARLPEAVNAWAEKRRLRSGFGDVAETATVSRRQVTIVRDQGNGLWLDARVGKTDAPSTTAIMPLPPVGAELAFFQQHGLLRSLTADLVWSQLAAITLHLLARRIPWFQHASAAHLARNFLSGASTYTAGPAGIEAELPRAPLQLALRMAGWQTHNLIPWLPGGELTLRSD